MRFKMINEINGFENIIGYSIWDNGDIYSHFKRYDKQWIILKEPYRKLKFNKNKKGYLKVCLGIGNNKHKTISVHRLVGLAFIPNPENKPQINHIDCNKENNNVENLEWVTNQENHKHKCDNGLNVVNSGEKHYMKLRGYKEGDHHCCKKVYQYDLEGNFIASYKSVTLASKAIGINYTNIVKVCTGKTKTAGGYKWKYSV